MAFPMSSSADLYPALVHFREKTSEMVDLISDLARMDTPTGNPEAIARFVERYAALLEDAGARARIIPSDAGPHLHAEVSPAGRNDLRPVLIVGHCDTVWGVGEAARRPPRVEGGRLHGPGVLDMKAGLGILVFVLRRLRRAAPRPIRIFISSDEEAGSVSARPHLHAVAAPAVGSASPGRPAALVLEPPLEDGGLKLERKGVGMYRLAAAGRAAHAGIEPERGASAIESLARAIAEIASWRDPARGIGINIGRVEGGIASNVVPDRAWAEIDVRFRRPPEGEEIDRRLRALRPAVAGTSFSIEGGIVFPPMVPGPESLALADAAKKLGRRVGLSLTSGASGGGSDGSYLASIGIPALDGIGADGAGAHTPGEHVIVDRLAPRAALLSLLIEELP
jgi:glutamate carboxypeptidase